MAGTGESAADRYGTIPRMVRANAVRFGERDAVVDGETRLSFADVEQRMIREFVAGFGRRPFANLND